MGAHGGRWEAGRAAWGGRRGREARSTRRGFAARPAAFLSPSRSLSLFPSRLSFPIEHSPRAHGRPANHDRHTGGGAAVWMRGERVRGRGRGRGRGEARHTPREAMRVTRRAGFVGGGGGGCASTPRRPLSSPGTPPRPARQGPGRRSRSRAQGKCHEVSLGFMRDKTRRKKNGGGVRIALCPCLPAAFFSFVFIHASPRNRAARAAPSRPVTSSTPSYARSSTATTTLPYPSNAAAGVGGRLPAPRARRRAAPRARRARETEEDGGVGGRGV